LSRPLPLEPAALGAGWKKADGIFMRMIVRGLIVLILVAVLGGVVYLMTWDVPPPTQKVEKVLPDDRFPD